MLRKNFIKRKLKLIQDDIAHLANFKKFTIDQIAHDVYKLATLERLLERVIMRAIDINEHMIAEKGTGQEKITSYRDTFLSLANLKVYPKPFAEQIAKSAGLRNAIVHEYDDLDLALVHASIGQALKQYLKYCQYVLKFIES